MWIQLTGLAGDEKAIYLDRDSVGPRSVCFQLPRWRDWSVKWVTRVLPAL
jgi:hypothetical protein